MLIAKILSPVSARSLQATLVHLARAAPGLQGRQSAVKTLLESGHLESAMVDDVRYVWPAGPIGRKQPDDKVRFLAPFDPLVWDRRRFEHFWGWAYRFEAYTPLARRKLGYYAMPVLWRDDVVGWVNISNEAQLGFSKGTITDAAFQHELKAEVERLRMFLGVDRLPVS